MKRLQLLSTAIASLCMFAAFGAASSLATSCFQTAVVGKGAFPNSKCENAGTPRDFIKAGDTFGWQKLNTPDHYLRYSGHE